MRFTNPCDECEERGVKCKIICCEKADEYHDAILGSQWLKQLKY